MDKLYDWIGRTFRSPMQFAVAACGLAFLAAATTLWFTMKLCRSAAAAVDGGFDRGSYGAGEMGGMLAMGIVAVGIAVFDAVLTHVIQKVWDGEAVPLTVARPEGEP
jgi:hypothetical protein